jgi:hypothetical protein
MSHRAFVPKPQCTESSGACFAAGECLSDCARVPQREHIASEHCWCQPTIEHTDEETGISVWLHRMAH